VQFGELKDKACLVTGASRGIGAAIALAFGREGAMEARAAEVVAAIEAAGDRTRALVNNAGILNAAPLDQMSEAVWDAMIASNLRSVFLCTRTVLPSMLARGRGKIINVTSQLGQKGMPNHTHYAAAKAGVIGFTRALAREVGPRGVHVNAIAPGPIETELIGPVSDEFRREKTAIFALRRFGRPDEVAPTAVFLASDDSSYYAGQTLCPNGGDIMV